MTLSIDEKKLEEMLLAELVKRLCDEIQDWWSETGRDLHKINTRTYKKELGEAIRKIFREQPRLVDDAVERASKYLYEKGKAVLVKKIEER